jgi:hypothetical protein
MEVDLRPDLPRGVAAISAGIAPIPGIPLPAQGKLEPLSAAVYGVTAK